MANTMSNGKTFLQNVDGLLTFQANFIIFKIVIKAFLIIAFISAPIFSFLIMAGELYVNNEPKFQPLKQDFLVLQSQRANMDYLDYCGKVYDLDEKWDNVIEETEPDAPNSSSPLAWLAFIAALPFAILYYFMCRHYWRTPFRIIHFPYLAINLAFMCRFFASFENTGLKDSIYCFFAYNYTAGFYFWQYVNIAMFFFYILFYFVFMFGRPEPESRGTRFKEAFFNGESVLPALLW